MRLKKTYDTLTTLPFGKWLFSRCISFMVPYSGTVKPKIVELKEGFCHLTIKDRRKIRNHLGSIHAIALMNAGEMVTGIPLMYTLPESGRAIITHLEMDYKKKARGELHCYCQFELEKGSYEQDEIALYGEIKDSRDDTVALSKAVWKVDAQMP